MSVRLFASGPCSITVSGRLVRLDAGDRITLSNADAEQAMRTYARNRLVIVSEITESQEYVEPKSQDYYDTPVLSVPVEAQAEEDYSLPIPKTASWRMVINYLRSKEEINELKYDEVLLIKNTFVDYPSVQRECDRLLSALEPSGKSESSAPQEKAQ